MRQLPELVIPKHWWLTSNMRLHWAEKAKRTKKLRELSYLAARETAPVPTPTLIAVTIHIAAQEDA